jgi:hypothetical protein
MQHMPTDFAPHRSASRYIMASLVLILFITVMLLVILRSFASPASSPGPFRTYNDGYADGFNAARTSIARIMPQNLTEPSLLHGVVMHVDKNGFTMRTDGLIQDSRVDGIRSDRIVYVTADTRITLSTRVPDTVFAEQLSQHLDAQKERIADSVPLAPPNPYATSRIALDGLIVGDRVAVRSRTYGDLATAPTIDATEVAAFR